MEPSPTSHLPSQAQCSSQHIPRVAKIFREAQGLQVQCTLLHSTRGLLQDSKARPASSSTCTLFGARSSRSVFAGNRCRILRVCAAPAGNLSVHVPQHPASRQRVKRINSQNKLKHRIGRTIFSDLIICQCVCIILYSSANRCEGCSTKRC